MGTLILNIRCSGCKEIRAVAAEGRIEGPDLVWDDEVGVLIVDPDTPCAHCEQPLREQLERGTPLV